MCTVQPEAASMGGNLRNQNHIEPAKRREAVR